MDSGMQAFYSFCCQQTCSFMEDIRVTFSSKSRLPRRRGREVSLSLTFLGQDCPLLTLQ